MIINPKATFYPFAKGLKKKQLFRTDHPFAHELIRRSYLREEVKGKYTLLYQDRHKALTYNLNKG